MLPTIQQCLCMQSTLSGKCPNEVTSCLDFYISTLGDSTKKLHIFVYNCFSQNKNQYSRIRLSRHRLTRHFLKTPNKTAAFCVQFNSSKSSSANSSFRLSRHRFCFPLNENFVYFVNHQPI